MKKVFYLCCFIFSYSFSQPTNWWVFFNDKSCSNEINLSKESIERRLNQGIALDFHDLPVCEDYINILKNHDVTIRYRLKWFNAVTITINSKKVLNEIKKHNFIKDVYPVAKFATQKELVPTNNQTQYYNRFRYSTFFPYGASFNQIDMLGGVDLHNQGFLGNNIIIAVFDAGFTSTETLPIFNNLWDNNRILDMYDFVDNDADVFGGSTHGTMVLSTMGGYMVDSLIGTAPEASYMLFRTEDSESETLIEEDNWVAAAEYADSAGAHIINSSLGYTILYDDTLNSHSYSDMDGNSTIITNAADLASSRGILVVNSAGNSGNSDWYYIGAPADGDSVLAVGAVNSFGEIASFSSRGPSYDGRIKPNVCGQGVSSVVADLDSTIRVANGTSFSSPIIAGLAACLWQSNTDLTNIELLEVIEESAHLFNNPNDSLGYGIPNFSQAYLNSLGIKSENFSIQCYPNPFQKELIIYNEKNIELNLDIFNIMGVCVFYKNINKSYTTIDLSEIKSGIYFLKIRENTEIYTIIKI